MKTVDLDNITSKKIRVRLEQELPHHYYQALPNIMYLDTGYPLSSQCDIRSIPIQNLIKNQLIVAVSLIRILQKADPDPTSKKNEDPDLTFE